VQRVAALAFADSGQAVGQPWRQRFVERDSPNIVNPDSGRLHDCESHHSNSGETRDLKSLILHPDRATRTLKHVEAQLSEYDCTQVEPTVGTDTAPRRVVNARCWKEGSMPRVQQRISFE